MAINEAVARGRQALKEGRWADARAEFESSLELEESPEAFQGLGDALWWLGDLSGCLRAMERAYAVFRDAGALFEAAIMCLWLAGTQLKSLGNRAACSGWISTAARIVDEGDLDPLRGWVYWGRSFDATEPEVARQWAERSLVAAREQSDRDLQLCALAELGKALVGLGQEAKGMALIDEAMAAVMGGESQSIDTVVITCCSMLGACDLAADLERVAQWCRAADRFMQTFGSPFLYADCRVRYGGVLMTTGHWTDAERELQAAANVTSPDTSYYQQALARLATLRVRQGRLEDAEALLLEIRESPAALPPLGAIHHLRGEYSVAEKVLSRYLALPDAEPAEQAQALDHLVGCLVAQGKLDAAGDKVRVLEQLAAGGMPRVAAYHALAAARVLVALGDRAGAETILERAMQLFSSCRMPYETARSRLMLAEALAGQADVAIAEAQGAFSTFDRMGAAADCDAAARLIRNLGGAARTGPKHFGLLTRREQEVLRLLGAGMSNPEIAERLFLSRKTVSHHVSNILGKLGLRNRSEAATYAVRTQRSAASG